MNIREQIAKTDCNFIIDENLKIDMARCDEWNYLKHKCKRNFKVCPRSLEHADQILSLIIKELKVIGPYEMLQPVWGMGLKAEREHQEITQAMRFEVIAQAQYDSIIKQLRGE